MCETGSTTVLWLCEMCRTGKHYSIVAAWGVRQALQHCGCLECVRHAPQHCGCLECVRQAPQHCGCLECVRHAPHHCGCLSYKILTNYVYYYCILIRIEAVGTFFFRASFSAYKSYSLFSSYLLLLLCLISFLLFPCANIWENTRARVPYFL